MAIDREKVLLAAQGFIQRKRYDKAVAEYQKIIQQDPDDARTLLKIGDLQSKMEAHAEAIATYERVGKHYAKQGFALKAIAVYKQIREIIGKHVPNLADRYAHITPQLAELYAQLGLVSDALAAYDEVATQLQRTGQDARAVEVFQQIVALDATNPLPHLRLAEAYSRIRNTDEAIEHFATAAEILLKLKRHEDALKVLERLLHHRAEPAYARRAAEIYLTRGQANDGMLALAKLQICFQADPKSIETLTLLARAFVLIGQPAKSIEVQKELVRIAKETNNQRVWRENIDKLMLVAPGDEQVQRLASSPPGRGVSSMPALVSDPPISINDSEIEELSEADIEVGKQEPPRPPGPSVRPQAAPRMPQFSAPEVEVGAEATADPNEYGDYADLDPALHPRRILSDAESFHKLGLYAKAIDRLSEGIEVHQQSVPIRRKLRDILYESGDYPRTADEMVTIASILLDNGDAEGSAEELAAVLSFMPDHGPARTMLLDMGYELPTSQYDTIEEIEGQAYREPQSTAENMDPPPGSARGELDSAPLPSYDLEEVGAAEAMSSPGYDVTAEAYERGLEASKQGGLPSFPMEDQDESPRPSTQKAAAEVKAGPLANANWGVNSDSIEDALEEAEFFLSRGLLDDARAILEETLKRVPNHPLLVERLRELDLTITQTTGSSGTRERPLNQPDGEGGQDRAFDIAASLDALDALDSPASAANPTFSQPTEQVDVEEVFAKFKAGVRAQVSETDSATHYDLGLAYREMGLFDDAIDEFEVAARDPKRECVCQSMIGVIQRNKGNVNAAIDAFIKGLHAEAKTGDQELSLYYELGDAYESKGNGQEALYYFRKVAHRSPNHDDPRGAVAVRIRNVQGAAGPVRPSMERAVGASDEFDAAFDAAIGTDSKP